MEEKQLSEKYVDDADWATAAEQSSEDDEAQEGNYLADQERSAEAAEHVAVHVVDEGDVDDLDDADIDDIDISDPEADAIVNDALEIDKADEAEAAAEVLTDSLAEEQAEAAAQAAEEVTPYDGPELGDDDTEDAEPTPTSTRSRRSAPSCGASPASGTSSTPTRASSAR